MTRSFIQISDTHIDEENIVMGVNSSKNLDIIINDLKKQKFELLLISGDLTQNGDIKSYKKIKEKISAIKNKIYAIPGNHDNLKNMRQIFNAELKNNIILDDWQIINVDSTQKGKESGFLSKDAIDNIYASLTNNDNKYSIICLHHPIVSMESTWDDSISLQNPEELFKIIDKQNKIKAVIWGHAHQSATFKYKNTKLFSCPSTALQFYGSDKIGYNQYYLYDNGDIKCHTKWL